MPERRPAGRYAVAQRLVEASRPQAVHRPRGRADARQHRELGLRDVLRPLSVARTSAPRRSNATTTERRFPAP